MVRLKDLTSDKASEAFKISIPYGAIKSGQIGNKWDDYGISIPYGAIKRYPISTFDNFLIGFQFLMVRLKAKIVKSHFFYRIISIPYGAIKSYNKRQRTLGERDFNSLWCD